MPDMQAIDIVNEAREAVREKGTATADKLDQLIVVIADGNEQTQKSLHELILKQSNILETPKKNGVGKWAAVGAAVGAGAVGAIMAALGFGPK